MKRNLFIVTVAFLVIFFMLIIGNIVTVGEKLTRITGSLYAEYILYGMMLMVFAYLLLWPILRLHLTPEFPILSIDGDDCSFSLQNKKKLDRFYRSLMSNCNYLPEKEREVHQKKMNCMLGQIHETDITGVKELIQNELDDRFKRIDKRILGWGKTVFMVTALSQNGKLDAIMVMVLNYRMIADIIRASGYRPTTYQLTRQYIRILTTAFFGYIFSEGLSDAKNIDINFRGSEMEDVGVDSIDFSDADISSLISKVRIPGIVTSSLADGFLNALLTLRVGYVTKAYLKKGANGISGRNSKIVRREAMKESRKALMPMIKEMIGSTAEGLSGKIKNVFNLNIK